ncbi:hypothetical protein [Janthinobacterium sp. TND4EL3]|uniref:hypothetical protein n=1 Tax=Janthinobacterium sp. TND4EL3 TaxID=1907311 RepID=UPI000970BA25|nr:hypothetical protein [Janthinobacterium sp. TND4EL3]
MSPTPGSHDLARPTIFKVIVPGLVAAVTVLLFFGYWSLHSEPDGAAPSRQQVEAQEKAAAKDAIELCQGRAKALPAGSGEAQIAQDACQQMQAQYEQTYRLTP